MKKTADDLHHQKIRCFGARSSAVGIDDRDYMRERFRKRRGIGKTRWNSKKDRTELEDNTPLGSASWVGTTNVRKVRYRQDKAQKWVLLLCAISIAVPFYRDAKRSGWLPDLEASTPFPATGSVTVNRSIDPKTATARMSVTTDGANAVIQLYDRETERHVISAYVRKHDHAVVPVPPGRYRMEVIEGHNWHGPERYFGASTTYETVMRPMIFTRSQGDGIDLHRSSAGDLRTSANLTDPKPLD